MQPLTLQARIIVLLTIFSVVSIAVFIAIQLTHEMNNFTAYKILEAQVTSSLVENDWEKASGMKVPEEMKIIFVQKRLNSLEESGAILKAYAMDPYGKIVSFTKNTEFRLKGDSDDFNIISKARKNGRIKGEIIADRRKQELSIYLPLKQDDQIKFIVRIAFSLRAVIGALRNIALPAFLVGICVIIANVMLGAFLSRTIVGPIKVFSAAAGKIAGGQLHLKVKVETADELETLAEAFNTMTVELAGMKKRAENANPLTKLPGNIMIMEKIEKRIKQGRKFTVIYCDLDNFKAFNDKYGIHRGDEAIKLAGNLFKEAAKAKGNNEDFIGHEGGDDFILLTTPDRAKDMAQYMISEFDKRIRFLYDQEDLKRGAIVASARDGTIQQFPIMTISLAGVSNEHRVIKSYAEVTNIAAEIKKKAKLKVESCFENDTRRG